MMDPESLQNCSTGNQKCCVGCCGLVSFIGLIFFIILMSAYAHLGPDDQVVIKSASGKSVVNGPTAVQLNPFKSKEWRKAPLLDPLQYAVVQDTLTAIVRHEEGPQLLFMGAYDELKDVKSKLVLEKDEYVRLVDKKTGNERVEAGPRTIVPSPSEYSPNGTQTAVFLDTDSAAVVLHKTSGLRRLVTACNHDGGVFTPQPLEEVVEVRQLIHVLPHEAMIVRDVEGTMTVYSGAEEMSASDLACQMAQGASAQDGQGTAFFLPPYSKIVRMFWSDYSAPVGIDSVPTPAPAAMVTTTPHGSSQQGASTDIYMTQNTFSTHAGPKVAVVKIDLRARKSFYSYEVRTSDNVKLRLDGTIFWQVADVRKMINMTSDPEGDVWHKSRSSINQAVSNVTLDMFMNGFNDIVMDAFARHSQDAFFTVRGLKLSSMELTKYTCVDAQTASTLQNIIRETTNRINRLQKQRSENEVRQEKLSADINLESNRTLLIETEALNAKLLAETRGATDGGGVATSIASFIDGLNTSLPDIAKRMELYRLHESHEASKRDTQQLASGNASLFISPKEMALRLAMPHSGGYGDMDRRLAEGSEL